MYIKEDGDRKNHKGQGKSDEENWEIRSPEEVLGDDELVEGIFLKDIPNGKRVEMRLSRRGLKKLYDEGVRVAKHDGFSDAGADAFAKQLIDVTLQSYVKGYVKSKFGMKSDEFDVIHRESATDAIIDELKKHNTDE